MIDAVPFGVDLEGNPVRLWRLHNNAGAMACISELGATLVRLDAPDRERRLADVTLGFDSASAYLADNNYLGCVVGRYANRIAGGSFVIDGQRFRVPCNDGGNVLHGGAPGFHRRLWRASLEGAALQLALESPDGEAGFPGAVSVTARFAFTDDFKLVVEFVARTTAPTPLNLTLHAYWNLGGSDSALDHRLSIMASGYTPVRADKIPIGVIAPVTGTPFDFRVGKTIGRDIGAQDSQLALAGGYDHNFVLDGVGLRPVARLVEEASGRRLTLTTDQPGLQLYTFNAPALPLKGKEGRPYPARSAVALEPQGFPDAPNQAQFPNTTIQPGEIYRATTIYAFDVVA